MESVRFRRTIAHHISLRAVGLIFLPTMLLIAGAEAATTQYSYDNLGRLTQAAQTNGSTVQYQYDANGNPISSTLSNNSTLTLNTPLNINVATPGQTATLSFSATAGQSLTLNLIGISSSPAGSAVTVSVYNPSGVLVTSSSGSTTTTLTLNNLSAGTYSVVITPQIGTTAAMQVSLASAAVQSTDADAPLPAWAMLALGLGLLGITRRFVAER